MTRERRTMIALTFGTRLRVARQRRDLTAAKLSQISGIAAASISHFETDNREPSADSIRKLARALDITADFLLGLSAGTHRINTP